MATTTDELHNLIDQMSAQDQQRILAFARELAGLSPHPPTPLPPGTPGSAISDLRVSPEGGEAMEHALEDCERIEA